MVPAASAEVPETVVTGAVAQIGPFTFGVNANLLIVAVTEPVEGQRLVPDLIAVNDNVSHCRPVSDKLPIDQAPPATVVVVPI